MKKPKVAVIGKWIYPESIELFFFNAFKSLGYETIKSTNPVSNMDISFVVKGEFINPHKLSGVKVLYFPDSIARYESLFDKIEKGYDFVFLGCKETIINNQRFFYAGYGYDLNTHYPLDKKKRIDVAFVGTAHRGREFIKKIPNIVIFGNDWEEGIFSVYGTKKRAIYAKTRIMTNHILESYSENMRCYEGLAMKTFMLSNKIPEHLKGGMVKYDNFDDLLKKIEYYLKYEGEREKIVERGYDMVQSFTYEKRVEEMMEVVKKWV